MGNSIFYEKLKVYQHGPKYCNFNKLVCSLFYNVAQCQYADLAQSKLEVYARFAQVKMNELKILRRGESELNPFKVWSEKEGLNLRLSLHREGACGCGPSDKGIIPEGPEKSVPQWEWQIVIEDGSAQSAGVCQGKGYVFCRGKNDRFSACMNYARAF